MQELTGSIDGTDGRAMLAIRLDQKRLDSIRIIRTEGKRDVESLIAGKRIDHVPLIVSRICGSCGITHHLASLHAIERAKGIEPSEQTIKLRRLANIGSIISSHAHHLGWNVIPEMHGCRDALQLNEKQRKDFELAQAICHTGDALLRSVVGRRFHPLRTRIGGWSRLPDKRELQEASTAASAALEKGGKLAELIASMDTEFFARKCEYACLSGNSYPSYDGSPFSLPGPNPAAGILTGPLARMNCSFAKLAPPARKAVKNSRVIFPNYNPFISNFCQAVEILQYLHDAQGIISGFDGSPGEESSSERSAGFSLEGPRGVIRHEYEIEGDRVIKAAITHQGNQQIIEQDLQKLLPRFLKGSKEDIMRESSKLIRAYDPCLRS